MKERETGKLIGQCKTAVVPIEHKPRRLKALMSLLKRIALPALVFIWPFFYLFNLVIPINGKYVAISNDFIPLYYKYKLYLLANLAEFRFPLWSPSEAAGFPFYTSPFAQTLYPLNLPLVIWYKIFGSYSPLDHQIFTVLGISIFALGLFMWLRLINKNIRAVLFATLVMATSFKVTELIRFPNAAHTAAWYPWALYAMTKIILSPSLKKAVQYGLLLTCSLICICTGGYPYFAYYSQFLFAPYLLVFFIKPLRIRLIGTDAINWNRALLTLALAGFAAAVICSPYIFGVKQLVSQTVDRSGANFDFATAFLFNLKDTVGSLVYPAAANVEGWYFFSITALLIISIYLFSRQGQIQDSIQNSDNNGKVATTDLAIKLFFVAWIAVISYITYGRDSYLFAVLWKYLPGFSRLRVWGRMNIILVPILAWLLSLAYAYFESLLVGKIDSGQSGQAGAEKLSIVFRPIVTLAVVYGAILAIQLYMYYKGIFDFYWIMYFKELIPLRIKFITRGAVGFAYVFTFMILAKRIRPVSRHYPAMMVVILLAAAVFEMRYMAIQIWTYRREWKPQHVKLNVPQINNLSFQFKRIDQGYNTISIGPAFSVNMIANWYFDRYSQFLKNTENEQEARRILLGVYDGTKIFFSESIQHPTVMSFLQDAARYRMAIGRLISYNGDELQWEIDAPGTGYLSFIDNWDWGWNAWVDEHPTEIELLFGTFKSVRLSAGRHTVRFLYQPGILPVFIQKSEYVNSKTAPAQ